AWWDGIHALIVTRESSFTRDGETVDFSYFEVAETDGWGQSEKAAKPAKKAAKKPAKKAAAKKDPEPEPEPVPVAEVEAGGSADARLLNNVREHCANTASDTHDDW